MSLRHTPGGCCCDMAGVFDFYGGLWLDIPVPGEVDETTVDRAELYMTASVLPQSQTAIDNVHNVPGVGAIEFYTSLDDGWSIPMYANGSIHQARIQGTRTCIPTGGEEIVWCMRSGNKDHPDAQAGDTELLEGVTAWDWDKGSETKVETYDTDDTDPSIIPETRISRRIDGTTTLFRINAGYVGLKLPEETRIIFNCVFRFGAGDGEPGATGEDKLVFLVNNLGEDGGGTQRHGRIYIDGSGTSPVIESTDEIWLDPDNDDEPFVYLSTEADGYYRIRAVFETTQNTYFGEQETMYIMPYETVGDFNSTGVKGDDFFVKWASVRDHNIGNSKRDLVAFNVTKQEMEEHVLPELFYNNIYQALEYARGEWNDTSLDNDQHTPAGPLNNAYNYGHSGTQYWQTGSDGTCHIHYYPGSGGIDDGGYAGMGPWTLNEQGDDSAPMGTPPEEGASQFSQEGSSNYSGGRDFQGPFHYYVRHGGDFPVEYFAAWNDFHLFEYDNRLIYDQDGPVTGGTSCSTVIGASNARPTIPRIKIIPPHGGGLVFSVQSPKRKYWAMRNGSEDTLQWYDQRSTAHSCRVGLGVVQPIKHSFSYTYGVDYDVDEWEVATGKFSAEIMVPLTSVTIWQRDSTQTRLYEGGNVFAGTTEPAYGSHYGYNVWVTLLWGDALGVNHYGAVIVDSHASYTINDFDAGWLPGETPVPSEDSDTTHVVRVLIGGNDVWNREIYSNQVMETSLLSTSPDTSRMAWISGLRCIPKSTSEQGGKRLVVWFEQLWEEDEEPAEGSDGITTGRFRMHVTNFATGADVWTLDSEPLGFSVSGSSIIGTKPVYPCVYQASNRLMYVKDFKLRSDALDGNQTHSHWLMSHAPLSGGDGPQDIIAMGTGEDADYTAYGGRTFKTVRMLTEEADLGVQSNCGRVDCVKSVNLLNSPLPGMFSIDGEGPLTYTPEVISVLVFAPIAMSSTVRIEFDQDLAATPSTTDFELVTTGDVAGTIASVTPVLGSQYIYDVTVTGITGTGTLGLQISDAAISGETITSDETGAALIRREPRESYTAANVP